MDKRTQQYILDNPSEIINYTDINKLTKKFIKSFVIKHGIEYINENIILSDDILLEAVKHNGYEIRFINNPTEKICLEAVNNKAIAIKYIDNPSERVQIESIKKDHLSLYYLFEKGIIPSEYVQMEAIINNEYSFNYLIGKGIKLSKRIQLEAINRSFKIDADFESLIPFLKDMSSKPNDIIFELLFDYIINYEKEYDTFFSNKNYDCILNFLIKNPIPSYFLSKYNMKFFETVKYFQKNPNTKSQVVSLIYLLNSKKYNNQFITKEYLMHRTYHSLKRK